MEKQLNISLAEWPIMKAVWSLPEKTSRNIVAVVQENNDWSTSTIKTMIGRLVKKGFLQQENDKKPYTYVATVAECDTMKQEAEDLFAGFCPKQDGNVLLDLVEHVELTQAEIAQMEKLLAQKKQTAPQEIACDCI